QARCRDPRLDLARPDPQGRSRRGRRLRPQRAAVRLRGLPRVKSPRSAGRVGARRRELSMSGPCDRAGSGRSLRAHSGGARTMNLDLTDEQILIRETARDFADREIIPRARENDRNERFDLELVKRIAEMGYLGAPVAEEYGGRS